MRMQNLKLELGRGVCDTYGALPSSVDDLELRTPRLLLLLPSAIPTPLGGPGHSPKRAKVR